MNRPTLKLILGASLACSAVIPITASALPESVPMQGEQDSSPLRFVERGDDELLVFEMRLGRQPLGDGVVGYLADGRVLLPLFELTNILDFPINVEPEEGQANGWFLREDRTFSLDVARGEVHVEGERFDLDSDLLELHRDDIFVEASLLSTWFPIDFEHQLSRLLLTIEPREPLPLQERMEREQKLARFGRNTARGGASGYPLVANPYRLAATPFIDVSLIQSYKDSNKDERNASYSLSLGGDLLYMSSNLYLSGDDQDSLGSARWTLSRRDDRGIFEFADWREMEVGDTFAPSLPLAASGGGGRGVSVSNFPLSRATEFDATTLRGDLPLGWVAELYRNEVLIGYQESRADGRYEFAEVPLLYGMNQLQVVLFGPQGQRRERVERVMVGSDLVQPGRTHYQVALIEEGKNILPISDDSGNSGDSRLAAEIEHGISKNLSVTGGIASYVHKEERGEYASLGVRTSVWGAFSSVDYGRDPNGGDALQLQTQTRFGKVNLSANVARFDGFDSDRETLTTDPLKYRTGFRLDLPLQFGQSRIPVGFSATQDRYELGRRVDKSSLRISGGISGVSLSNTFTVRQTRGMGTGSDHSTIGSLLVGGRLDRVSLRGKLDYQLDPSDDLTQAAVSGSYRFKKGFNTQFSVTRNLGAGASTVTTVGLNRLFEQFSFGANASYDDRSGDFFAGLSVSFGLVPDANDRNWNVLPTQVAGAGAAVARVYLEQNDNGVFDEEDTPLEGVRLRRVGGDAQTDENGLISITRLTADRPVPVEIDTSTLEDPFWIVAQPGYEVIGRPGIYTPLEFAVTQTTEIDGVVRLRRDEGLTEVANVEMQLVDEHGEVVKEVKSSFDGFYLFTSVLPGDYELRVSPKQLERLRVSAAGGRKLHVGRDGVVLSGEDIVLEREG